MPPPPGTYHTSWVGNSFGGNGAKENEGAGFQFNGYGYWVQDDVDAMAVSPDGTVFNTAPWDEGGHGIGLYKNGHASRIPIIAPSSTGKFGPGFNTSGPAICVDGRYYYAINRQNELLRFSWTPGDIDSTVYLGQTVLPETATSMACRKNEIAVSYADKLEYRNETTLAAEASYDIANVTAMLFAADGSIWVVKAGSIRHLTPNGTDTGVILPGIGDPTSLAWANNGWLIVTDNGPAQQVLFFDVSAAPKLAGTFGAKGGLYADIPGSVAPDKLFGLRGAGMDTQGNLYVGMSFGDSAASNAFIAAYTLPKDSLSPGNLLWLLYNASWLNTSGFEPGTDGTGVISTTTTWKLNYKNQTPGSEASLQAITLDPFKYPQDPRLQTGFSMQPRLVKGTKLVYAIPQVKSFLLVFANTPGSEILHQVAATPASAWSWFIDDDGNIWDADGPQIREWPVLSVSDGIPNYDWKQPRVWPRPDDFQAVTRLIYNKATDSLYLFGFLQNQPIASGSVTTAGIAARRYDGWLHGTQEIVWTNAALPTTTAYANGGFTQLPAKAVSLAGDYIFAGMVKNQKPAVNPMVCILDAKSGKYIGTLTAGPEVGGIGGWEDMLGSVNAMRRDDGEYIVLVEDDWRGKNIMFRWTP